MPQSKRKHKGRGNPPTVPDREITVWEGPAAHEILSTQTFTVVSTSGPVAPLQPLSAFQPDVMADPSIICAGPTTPLTTPLRVLHVATRVGDSPLTGSSLGYEPRCSPGDDPPATPTFGTLLSSELRELEGLLTLTDQERVQRHRLVHTVSTVLRKAVPSGARIEVYGSWATGLALPTSDTDFVVIGSGATTEVFEAIIEEMHAAGFACTLQLPKAKVPLLKFTSQTTQLKCDVSFDVTNSQVSVNNVTRLLDMYRDHNAQLLIVVTKLVLVLTGWNEVNRGGLSSYGVCLMVFALVRRMRSQGRSPCNPAEAFLCLLRHYGGRGDFDPSKHTVDCLREEGMRDGLMETRSFFHQHHRPSEKMWCVQDPITHDNNVAEASYEMGRISRHLGDMCSELEHLARQPAEGLQVMGPAAECPMLVRAMGGSAVLHTFIAQRRRSLQAQVHSPVRIGAGGGWDGGERRARYITVTSHRPTPLRVLQPQQQPAGMRFKTKR